MVVLEETARTQAVYDPFPWKHESAQSYHVPTKQLPKLHPSLDLDKEREQNQPIAISALAMVGKPAIVDPQVPFQSPRLRACMTGSLKDYKEAELEWTGAHSHGLGLGYNLFTAPPAPPSKAAPVKPSSTWLVNAKTLKGRSVGIRDADAEQAATRKRHETDLLLHNADDELIPETEALNKASAQLTSLNDEVLKVSQMLKGVAPGTNEAKRLAATARDLAIDHKTLSDATLALAEQRDTMWRSVLARGSAARKTALGRMAELSSKMQADLEDVMLCLTDHVLLGTEEEAERMAKAPGPDGERLRELRRAQAELRVRQRQQKVVLVSLARRAVKATSTQDSRISEMRTLLVTAAERRESLKLLAAVAMQPPPVNLAPVDHQPDHQAVIIERRVDQPSHRAVIVERRVETTTYTTAISNGNAAERTEEAARAPARRKSSFEALIQTLSRPSSIFKGSGKLNHR